MYVLKGFVTNSAFTNNAIPNITGETPGSVSTIGEISTLSLTYAQQKGYYFPSTGPTDLSLITFTSALNGVPQLLTSDISDHVLTVAQTLFSYMHTTGQIMSDTLLLYLLGQFSATANNFQCGTIISDGANWAPEWLSWTNTSLTELSAGNEIKVWFVDVSFRNEYDGSQIVVVPPTLVLDNFFNPSSMVATMLSAITPVMVMSAIQTAKNGCPETVVTCETFNYIDPLNSANVIPTNWYMLIYGSAGNNVDSMADALIAYILANSTHTEADWIKVLPDLFNRTEFVLVPLWDNYSIPNRTLQAGIYSPIASMTNSLALLTQVEPSYPSAHIDEYATLMSFPYKSMQIASIGSPNNKDAWYQINNVMPDVINVSSTSTDFSRMSATTQAWATMIANMLVIAETMTTDTTIPRTMTALTRNGILYLVQNYNNIDYLVAVKSNFPLP
jgi:hypothetical protein